MKTSSRRTVWQSAARKISDTWRACSRISLIELSIPSQDRVFRKPYVVFISAGNDGTGALNSIDRIALGYKFKKVYDPVISRGKLNDETIEKCRELGGVLAAGCEAGIY